LTLRLTVDTAAWRAHVERVASSYTPSALGRCSIVPVVKGNGYGFGRGVLARVADDVLATRRRSSEPATIAVGTVHELGGLPSRLRPVVLTPPGASTAHWLRTAATSPLVTIGDRAHVAALDGWRGEVLVKLASSMRRFGVAPRELDDFERSAHVAGLTVVGHSIHLPLAGDDTERAAEVERWLAVLDSRRRQPNQLAALWVSHIGPDAHAELGRRWPQWHLPIRLGTALWHGDKSALHLGADVLDIHTVAAGTVAGYHGTRVIADGTLVIVGAGTAHGVAVLDDGRSPFHFQRRRLALLERPHMHSSMIFVPTGAPCPAIGDVIDVQRPLTAVAVDELTWREPERRDGDAGDGRANLGRR
jgi:alanine racemase